MLKQLLQQLLRARARPARILIGARRAPSASAASPRPRSPRWKRRCGRAAEDAALLAELGLSYRALRSPR